MSSPTLKSVDQALDSIRAITNGVRARRTRRRRSLGAMAAWLGGLAIAVMIAFVLPFFLLIRVATAFYIAGALNSWVSIACGMLAAGFVILVYSYAIAQRIGLGHLFPRNGTRFVAAVVIAYCAYSLLYFSATNAKSTAVATTYTGLHPIVRLSVSTWLLVDRDAIVTDMGRSVAVYRRMGLPPNERSLHFEQADGYVHAVDLRTIGRAGLRNRMLEAYFRMLGFHTLRHIGTADHLHVSLPMAAERLR